MSGNSENKIRIILNIYDAANIVPRVIKFIFTKFGQIVNLSNEHKQLKIFISRYL